MDVLWGDVNPSGKLPFTMGKAVSDWPAGNIVRDMVGHLAASGV